MAEASEFIGHPVAPDPVLTFIGDYVLKHGRAPSKGEIRAFVDFRQAYPIERMLCALERLGQITAARRARG